MVAFSPESYAKLFKVQLNYNMLAVLCTVLNNYVPDASESAGIQDLKDQIRFEIQRGMKM